MRSTVDAAARARYAEIGTSRGVHCSYPTTGPASRGAFYLATCPNLNSGTSQFPFQSRRGHQKAKPPMSQTWFHSKAEQRAQLAKKAANPLERSLLEEQRRLWLQIAAAEARQEERRKKARAPLPSSRTT
jgi:hypothetical protein